MRQYAWLPATASLASLMLEGQLMDLMDKQQGRVPSNGWRTSATAESGRLSCQNHPVDCEIRSYSMGFTSLWYKLTRVWYNFITVKDRFIHIISDFWMKSKKLFHEFSLICCPSLFHWQSHFALQGLAAAPDGPGGKTCYSCRCHVTAVKAKLRCKV